MIKQKTELSIRIGRNILAMREEKHISCKQLAQALGKSVSQVRKYEQGLTDISASVLMNLKQIFGLKSIERLFK